jgi:hypothetical protein
MTEEQGQPVVVRAQGRSDGRALPVVGVPPHPGEEHPGFAVRWVEDGALLAVTTWGSSSHPTMPRAARVQDGELTLTIGRRETAPLPPGSVDVMTADLASHTTLIEPPAGLDPHTPTRVRVGEQTVELPPAGAPLPPPRPATPQPSDLPSFEGTPPRDTGEGKPPGAAGPRERRTR